MYTRKRKDTATDTTSVEASPKKQSATRKATESTPSKRKSTGLSDATTGSVKKGKKHANNETAEHEPDVNTPVRVTKSVTTKSPATTTANKRKGSNSTITIDSNSNNIRTPEQSPSSSSSSDGVTWIDVKSTIKPAHITTGVDVSTDGSPMRRSSRRIAATETSAPVVVTPLASSKPSIATTTAATIYRHNSNSNKKGMYGQATDAMVIALSTTLPLFISIVLFCCINSYVQLYVFANQVNAREWASISISLVLIFLTMSVLYIIAIVPAMFLIKAVGALLGNEDDVSTFNEHKNTFSILLLMIVSIYAFISLDMKKHFNNYI